MCKNSNISGFKACYTSYLLCILAVSLTINLCFNFPRKILRHTITEFCKKSKPIFSYHIISFCIQWDWERANETFLAWCWSKLHSMSVYQEQALFLLAESYFLASGLCMIREKNNRLSYLHYYKEDRYFWRTLNSKKSCNILITWVAEPCVIMWAHFFSNQTCRYYLGT